MHVDTTASNLQGSGVNIRLDKEPDICPICHKSVHPKLIHTGIMSERGMAQAVFRCTSIQCQELFLGTYQSAKASISGREIFNLIKLSPVTPNYVSFSDSIKDLSPTFIEIYNQAISAESSNLTQLVGIGLRKALEFLVKDFAISLNPDKEEEIKSTFLGKCINDYIEDANVKACAKRAAWLGNDETHYVRKWEEKDITDLKLLVRLTVNWAENVILTAKYIEDMDE